jgi:hypothetical protein
MGTGSFAQQPATAAVKISYVAFNDGLYINAAFSSPTTPFSSESIHFQPPPPLHAHLGLSLGSRLARVGRSTGTDLKADRTSSSVMRLAPTCTETHKQSTAQHSIALHRAASLCNEHQIHGTRTQGASSQAAVHGSGKEDVRHQTNKCRPLAARRQ